MENTNDVEFDFESTSNEVAVKTPCIKAINKNFCGERKKAGLWISDESMFACEWKRECTDVCSETCADHFVNTKPHEIGIKGGDEIKGRGIMNPRIFVIRKTDLLKIGENGKFCGIWKKGDGNLKDDKGNKMFTCVRKYLLMFSDDKNNFLHKHPIQFTAKGNCQIEFENKLKEFRKNVVDEFSKRRNKQISVMTDQWYAMLGFSPIFASVLVGATAQAEACVTTGYDPVTSDNWESKCIGYDKQKVKFISDIYKNSDKWIMRFSRMADVTDKDFFEVAE